MQNNHGNKKMSQKRSSGAMIKSMKARANARRSFHEKVADAITSGFGSFFFLVINAVWFFFWVIINVGLIPSITPFDPFPFGLLTMIVSLEAIILAIIVLVSQNRESKINDLRAEMDLQVDIITEQELTKVMGLVVTLMKKKGIDISKDEVLNEMLKPMDTDKIERALERETPL